MDIAIRVDSVSKKFCMRTHHIMLYGTIDLWRSFCGYQKDNSSLRSGEFWALDDISFEVKQGEAVGLIGPNGAGKSTMLKLLNGIYLPDSGRIEMYGRVGALIEVGAGFHPMLTGRENIYLNGGILGMSKAEIRRHFDEIVDFSGIEPFLDTPVRHYSSGMYVRLGFSIAVHSNPEILLVDEVLAVGDAVFRRKCLQYMKNLHKKGVTFIIVSHNMMTIEGITAQCLYFDKGKLAGDGAPGDVISLYEMSLAQKEADSGNRIKPDHEQYPDSLDLVEYWDYGTAEVHVRAVRLYDMNGEKKGRFDSDEGICVEAVLDSAIEGNVLFWLTLANSDNVACMGSLNIPYTMKKGVQNVRFTFNPLRLSTGAYKIVFVINDETGTNPYSNGHYGFFEVLKKSAVVNPGFVAPICWVEPEVESSVIIRDNSSGGTKGV
jgi:ABC-type polysaccharide/polyol phosphate transport system ATPase subunit